MDVDGDVGIGTTLPGYDLHVRGKRDLATLALESTAAGGRTWEVISTGGGSGAGQGKLAVFGNGAYRVVVDGDGNVGIGEASPQEKLVVRGSVQTSGTAGRGNRIVMQSTAAGGHQYEWYGDAPSAGSLSLYDRTRGDYSIAIGPDGNVGIGAPAPDAKLHVAGSTRIEGPLAVATGTTGGVAIDYPDACGAEFAGLKLTGRASLGCGDYHLLSAPGDHLYVNRPSGRDIRFREENADQLVLLAGGNVVVGGAYNSGAKLDVNGAAALRAPGPGAWALEAVAPNGVPNVQLGSWDANHGGLGLSTAAGARTVRLLATGDSYFSGGSLGVGTQAPSARLEVEGGGSEAAIHVDARDAGGVPVVRLQTQGSNRWGMFAEYPSGAGKLAFYNYDSGRQVMTLDKAGNVGIGTQIPLAPLDVAGNVRVGGRIEFPAAGSVIASSVPNHWEMVQDGSLNLRFQSWSGREISVNGLVASANGDVGIGVSPSTKLDVAGGARVAGPLQLASNVAHLSTACNAASRGQIVLEQGGAGVGDGVYVCLKTNAVPESYAWVCLATGNR